MTRSKRFNFDDLLIYVLVETAWKRRMVLLRGVKKINWHRMSFMSDVNVLSVLTFPQRTKSFHLVVESIDGSTKTSCFAIAIPICNCLVCQQRPKLRVCKNNSTQNSVRRLSAPQGEVLKMTWNRDKKSWRGETVKLRILLHVRFGGGSFKNDLES